MRVTKSDAAPDPLHPGKAGGKTRCPLQELLARLGDKWSMLVIVTLAAAPERTARFSELMRGIDGISQRMLTATLRHLERDGIVTRTIYADVPVRVEYALTALGGDLLGPVQAVVGWVGQHWQRIEKARAAFDRKAARD